MSLLPLVRTSDELTLSHIWQEPERTHEPFARAGDKSCQDASLGLWWFLF